MKGNATALFDVDWSPDGRYLVSGGSDSSVTIYDVHGEKPARVLDGHHGLVFGVGWNPNGRWLASGSWDTSIRLWDPISGECAQMLGDPDDPKTFFCGVAWSQDGQRLAGAIYLNPKGVLIWDLSTSSPHWVSQPHPTPIRRVAWSPDEARLAGGGDNGHVYLWAADGTLLHGLPGHQRGIKGLAWSPDGRRLATAGGGKNGGELFVWDAQLGELLIALGDHAEIVYAVSWGTSEEMLVSGGGDGALRWWNAHSHECMWEREVHLGTVQSLKRSPDGTRLASCGDDGAIMLWDLHSGEHLQTLRRDRPYERLDITGIRGLTEAQKATLCALGAIVEG